MKSLVFWLVELFLIIVWVIAFLIGPVALLGIVFVFAVLGVETIAARKSDMDLTCGADLMCGLTMLVLMVLGVVALGLK